MAGISLSMQVTSVVLGPNMAGINGPLGPTATATLTPVGDANHQAQLIGTFTLTTTELDAFTLGDFYTLRISADKKA